jgi:hypothetical protein
MRVAKGGWRWVFGCFFAMHNKDNADCGERDMSCCVAFTWRGMGRARASGGRDFLVLVATCDQGTSLTHPQYLNHLTCTLHTGRASNLRRRAHRHICCITSAAAQCSSHANMSDPPPAKKPAFSLYGDLIAPNGDSSVITSGPVKYDMKPKDLEPDAQKKKNGRVAFYISSS